MEDNTIEKVVAYSFEIGADQNINMVRGDTFSFGLELMQLDQDLESAFLTVRKSFDGDFVFQKSIGNGIEKVETGLYGFRIAPEDTIDLEAGHYYYDVQIGLNSDKWTIVKGDLWIQHDATY